MPAPLYTARRETSVDSTDVGSPAMWRTDGFSDRRSLAPTYLVAGSLGMGCPPNTSEFPSGVEVALERRLPSPKQIQCAAARCPSIACSQLFWRLCSLWLGLPRATQQVAGRRIGHLDRFP